MILFANSQPFMVVRSTKPMPGTPDGNGFHPAG
jgi:hypothetical protein